jgi:biopolymer transport protein ExbD
MMKRRNLPQAQGAIPNLAPMVDVVMVILIFFMLGASFGLSEGALRTQLPARIGPGGGARIAMLPTVQIAILSQDAAPGYEIYVMDQALADNSFAGLAALLEQRRRAGADPTGKVLIGADPAVAYQHVISAMDMCVRAGFSNIQFSVRSGDNASDDDSGAE